MIIYFADRKMNILGQASTDLPEGIRLTEDWKTQEVETGVTNFEFRLPYTEETRQDVKRYATVGNYILRQDEEDAEFYTIIEVESDSEKCLVDVYAEDAGLDLLNEIVGSYEADQAYPITHYIEKFTYDSGFEIGLNEISTLTRKLKWEGESTATERIDSVATQFDNAEISYSFQFDGFSVLHKYINIHKKRGKEIESELRMDRDINNIHATKSVEKLATALIVTGGTPEGSEAPITLNGYSYDDGDFYVDGTYVKSRKALEKWSRYLWDKVNVENDVGHIVRTFSYDTTDQSELCNRAISELKDRCEPEEYYEIELVQLPDNIAIGDTINVVDDNDELYLSARLLKLEKSVSERTQKATLGSFTAKSSGIEESLELLAEQFEQLAKTRGVYIWIAYADDIFGNGISLNPEGKKYMGTASNRMTSTPDISDPSVYTWVRVRGYDGQDGKDGKDGEDGKDGNGVDTIVRYYLATARGYGVTYDTDGWTKENQAITPTKKYLWSYEVITYTNGLTTKTEPVIIGVYGESGETARTYILSLSDTILRQGADGKFTPETISLKAYYRDGTNTARQEYSGRFVIEESEDGTIFSVKYTSGADEKGTTYTPSGADVSMIRCTLYAGGGITNVLDSQAVHVLLDVDGVEIGARNLLPDSDRDSLTAVSAVSDRYWSDAARTNIVPSFVTLSDPPMSGIKYGAQFDVDSTGGVRHLAFYKEQSGLIPLLDGETYTMSCYARGILTSGPITDSSGNSLLDSNGNVINDNLSSQFPKLRLQIGNGTPYVSKEFDLTKNWKHYSYTYQFKSDTWTQNTSKYPIWYFGCNGGNLGVVQLCGFQLEKGNIATDWTPAPEESISGMTRYYLIQDATAAVPEKPTTYPPLSKWITPEPEYQLDVKKSMYIVDLIEFIGGGWSYSEVNLSGSYEAAKEAYLKAQEAQEELDSRERTITSSTEPNDTRALWIDTSVSPPLAKKYDSESSTWVTVNDTSGIVDQIYKTVYDTTEKTQENVLIQLGERYYLKDEIDQLLNDVSTKYEQTAQSFDFRFNQITSEITELSNTTETKFTEVNKYIRFVDGSIIIGVEGNPLILRMKNDRISFLENENEVAYISNRRMYITDAEFLDSIIIGNFSFIPRNNGNLSFKKTRDSVKKTINDSENEPILDNAGNYIYENV